MLPNLVIAAESLNDNKFISNIDIKAIKSIIHVEHKHISVNVNSI